MCYAKPQEDIVIPNGTCTVIQSKTEGANAWRAYINGEKATEECPKRCVKTIYAPSRDALITKVNAWAT